MNATETAGRVVAWALLDQGPPPRGGLATPEGLARPPAGLRAALGELAAVTAARLRLAAPPCGAQHPPTADGLLLAAALGAAHTPSLARLLLAGLPPAQGVWDWLARHGLVAPALAHLPAGMAEDARAASPLSGLFDRPAAGQEAAARRVAARLRRHGDGRRCLVLTLAQPSDDPAVRRWRAALLDRLRLDGEEGAAFVLDVYEAAMVHHEDAHTAQARAARAVLADPVAAADGARLDGALGAAAWWGPLRALDRGARDALRGRRYLGYAYREGLHLHDLARRAQGAV